MPNRNQWSKGSVRRSKLPICSLTLDERTKVERYASRVRMSFSQLQRAGLVALGILDEDSVADMPLDFAERTLAIRKGGGNNGPR